MSSDTIRTGTLRWGNRSAAAPRKAVSFARAFVDHDSAASNRKSGKRELRITGESLPCSRRVRKAVRCSAGDNPSELGTRLAHFQRHCRGADGGSDTNGVPDVVGSEAVPEHAGLVRGHARLTVVDRADRQTEELEVRLVGADLRQTLHPQLGWPLLVVVLAEHV